MGQHETGAKLGRAPRLQGWTLDAAVMTLAVLMAAGVTWDFYEHSHGVSFAEEGFLTPSHTFFYSMFLGIAVVIGLATYANRRQGADWLDAVPEGYGLGVVGVAVFGAGGFGDFLWHSAFGFEASFEALTSPSHLMLALGAILFLSSPLRATWRREGTPSGARTLPAVVSAGLVMTVLALFTSYANPLMRADAFAASSMRAVGEGIASVVVFSLLLVAPALLLARRFDLPLGAILVLFALPTLATAIPREHFLFAAAAVPAGMVADGLIAWRRPTDDNPRAVRLFGVLVPATFMAGFIAVLAFTAGIGWRVHGWTGAIAIAGAAGLLLTYVVLPDGRATSHA